MKRLLILTMTVITIALFASSAVAYELPNYTEEVMENVADWLGVDVVSIERSEVEGLAHYTAILKVGDGDYDTIGVHRVVKETWPGIPQNTEEGVFCIHGDMNTFNLIYMTGTLSGYQEDADSLGVYMAQNGIDVWGIDLRWALIPPVTQMPTLPGQDPDPAVLALMAEMADWNTDTHLNDIELALRFSRLTRLFTGAGYNKMVVTGFSRGAYLTWALANKETQTYKFKRHVKAIVPVDWAYKLNSDNSIVQGFDMINVACARAAFSEGAMDYYGLYGNENGFLMTGAAYFAATDPEGPSILVPGFNNHQAFLAAFGATFQIWQMTMGGELTPWFHFGGVYFEPVEIEPGIVVMIPQYLLYSDENLVLDLALQLPPYQSRGEQYDSQVLQCGMVDSPYDDYLSEIDIPVLSIEARGGFGVRDDAVTGTGETLGEYTLSLIGTPAEDKGSIVVALLGTGLDDYAWVDFGHADLFFSDHAKPMVWDPMLQWIKAQ